MREIEKAAMITVIAEKLKGICSKDEGITRMRNMEKVFENLESDVGYEDALEIYQSACRKIEA